MNAAIEVIRPDDRLGKAEVEKLLKKEGIERDPHLDYTAGLYDTEGRLIATGSCFQNTIRCLAVTSELQGEGLMATVVSHLLKVQASRGNDPVFLYTKPESAVMFADLGFSEIVRLSDVVFMENRKDGFLTWLTGIQKTLSERPLKLPGRRKNARIAAVVMNANPFTLGHRYLLEQVSKENDRVILFLLSEENGPIPYAVRKKLVEADIEDLPRVVLVPAGSYIISHATFPSYFLKSEENVIRAHAELDLCLFGRIAEALGITRRYVGEEPFSRVTSVYNELMARELPKTGVECRIVPRLAAGDVPVSASTVREALQKGDFESLRTLLPESTYDYFCSEEAAPVLEAIRKAGDVRHY